MGNQWLHRWIPSFIQHSYDMCVSCHENTYIAKTMPIHLRKGYIEGAGQLCEPCYMMLYPPRVRDDDDENQ